MENKVIKKSEINKLKAIHFNLLAFLFYSLNSYAADSTTFPKLWEMVISNSPLTKAIILQKKASDKSTERLNRYYLPSFYLNSNLFSTNDPGLTFMNFLSEGQTKQDDFIPSNLNSPSNHIFNQSNIGIDYLVYDSGARAALRRSQEHESKSLENEQKLVLINQYVMTLQYFLNYILSNNYEKELKLINNNLELLIKKYKVGEKSNPVGYNGLLSLKNLQNQIDIINLELNSKIETIKNSLKLLTGNSSINIDPEAISFEKLLSSYAISTNENTTSFQVNLEKEKALSIKESITQEKSKYMPKIGFFGQENLAIGDRGSQTSYTFGIYLKLYINPSEFGGDDEKEIQTRAREKNAESIALNDAIILNITNKEIDKNNIKLTLLNKSEEIILEQTKIVFNLYNNGNTNISQISEIINKHIDILNKKYLLKETILKDHLELIKHSQKDVKPENIWNIKI